MKESVNVFLSLLNEAALDTENYSNEYERGVNETIELARAWFESNSIIEFDIKYQD